MQKFIPFSTVVKLYLRTSEHFGKISTVRCTRAEALPLMTSESGQEGERTHFLSRLKFEAGSCGDPVMRSVFLPAAAVLGWLATLSTQSGTYDPGGGS